MDILLQQTCQNSEFVSGLFIEVYKTYEKTPTEQNCLLVAKLLERYDREVLLSRPISVVEFVEILLSKDELEEESLRTMTAALSLMVSSLSDFPKEVKERARDLVPKLQELIQSGQFSVH